MKALQGEMCEGGEESHFGWGEGGVGGGRAESHSPEVVLLLRPKRRGRSSPSKASRSTQV